MSPFRNTPTPQTLPAVFSAAAAPKQKAPGTHSFHVYQGRINFRGATLFQAFDSLSARYLHISDF